MGGRVSAGAASEGGTLDAARLDGVYDALLAEYGPQRWWPVRGPQADAPLEVCVGAILVQHTTWEAAAAAVARLREAGALSIEVLATLPEDDLGMLLRGAGTYRTKARRLRAFAEHVLAAPGGTIEGFLAGETATVRGRCLAVWGIGPETADAIVLYAARLPTFVMDAYARRLFERLGSRLETPDGEAVGIGELGYEPARRALLGVAGEGVARLGEWHALIVAHGKARCRARLPRCEGCPLLDLAAGCPFGRAATA